MNPFRIQVTTANQPIGPPPLPNIIFEEDNLTDDEYFSRIPPGCRFQPTDEELIIDYLMKKINNERLPRNRINIVKLYDFDPDNLADRYRPINENEWYFFTWRTKKYRRGRRPNRSAGDGYWKATGSDIEIEHNREVVGCRKLLAYYKGKSPRGAKTDWLMHEFRVINPPIPVQTTADSMMLDWVICRLKKNNSSKNRNRNEEENDNRDQVVDEEEISQNPNLQLEEPHAAEALNIAPSIRYFDSGVSSYNGGIQGFNHIQAGMSNFPITNFEFSINTAPSMYFQPQNHILMNNFVLEGYPQPQMNHMSLLISKRQHQEINGNLGPDRQFG